jgi:hypothetical protein
MKERFFTDSCKLCIFAGHTVTLYVLTISYIAIVCIHIIYTKGLIEDRSCCSYFVLYCRHTRRYVRTCSLIGVLPLSSLLFLYFLNNLRLPSLPLSFYGCLYIHSKGKERDSNKKKTKKRKRRGGRARVT